MTIGSLVALAVAFATTVGGAAPAPTAPTAPGQRAAPSVEKPAFRHRFIPIDDARRRETSAYAQRHYGLRGSTIAAPHVIVEHLTVNDSVDATFNTFAPDVPDIELHELPGLCSQFVIARSGAIYQFTPITFMCRQPHGRPQLDGDRDRARRLSRGRRLRAPRPARRLPAPHALAALPLPDPRTRRDRPRREPLLAVPQRARRQPAHADARRLAACGDGPLPRAAESAGRLLSFARGRCRTGVPSHRAMGCSRP